MSNHCRVLFDQPIDDFNGLNFIEIISEDGGDNDLIVSKITLKDIDHGVFVVVGNLVIYRGIKLVQEIIIALINIRCDHYDRPNDVSESS